MPRTSYSSAGATRRSASLRREARRILERSENAGTPDSAVAAAILKDYAAQGVLPATEQESTLIENAAVSSSLPQHNDLSWNGRNRERYWHSAVWVAIIAGNGTYRNNSPKKCPRNNHNADSDASRVNLAQYATDCGKADYYGLFLYLWEDGPWNTINAYIFSSTFLTVVSLQKVYSNNPAAPFTPSHIPLKFPYVTEPIPGVFS
jgi:hypothetical protein